MVDFLVNILLEDQSFSEVELILVLDYSAAFRRVTRGMLILTRATEQSQNLNTLRKNLMGKEVEARCEARDGMFALLFYKMGC